MITKRYTETVKVKNLKRIIAMVLCDILIIIAASWLSAALRTGTYRLPIIPHYASKFREVIILCLATCGVLGIAGSYATSWRYADFKEYMLLYIGTGVATGMSYVLSRILVFGDVTRLDFSNYVIIFFICICGFTVERFMGRLIRNRISHAKNVKGNAKKTMVVSTKLLKPFTSTLKIATQRLSSL